MKKWFILLFIPTIMFALESDYVVVLSIQNQVEIRQPFEQAWQKASIGTLLKDRETIKCGASSYTKLKAYDGRIFTLGPYSQIETRDLIKLDQNDLVMELTALELQKLPKEKGKLEKPEAFILHGSADDLEKSKSVELERYVKLEQNGALALYLQNFVPGFILKYNRFSFNCPNFKSQKLDKALMESLKKMNLTARLNKLLAQNKAQN
jgi:hypothetical protein